MFVLFLIGSVIGENENHSFEHKVIWCARTVNADPSTNIAETYAFIYFSFTWCVLSLRIVITPPARPKKHY